MSKWSSRFGSASTEQIDGFEVGELLVSLTDKSLVMFDDSTGRYRLLETVRAYARIMLAANGAAESMRTRHQAHYLALAEEAEPELTGADQVAWLERLEVEHDNLRAALEWSAGQPEGTESGLRISGALWRFWFVRGHLSEGQMHLERALGREGAQDRTAERAKTLNGAGNVLSRQGNYQEARSLYEQSLAICRELGDRPGVARALGNMGNLSQLEFDYAASESLHQESLTIRRELGDRWGVGVLLGNLGKNAYCIGDYSAATGFQEESLAIFKELGHQWGIANGVSNLGDLSLQQGDYAAARALQQESLAIFRDLGDRWGIAEALQGLAAAAGGQGHGERAARFWGAAEALREANGSPMDPEEREKHTLWMAAARESVGAEAFTAALAEGRAMTMNQAIESALEDS